MQYLNVVKVVIGYRRIGGHCDVINLFTFQMLKLKKR